MANKAGVPENAEIDPDKTPPDVEQWPNASTLAAKHGVSLRQISRLASRGQLKRYIAPSDKTYRYDPTEAAEVLDVLKAPIETTAEAQEAMTEQTKVVTDAGADFLKLAHTHLEKTWGSVHEPARLILEMYKAECARLQLRVTELEAKRDELAAARETLLSEVHVREMAMLQEARAQDRKDKATQVFLDKGPQLLDMVQGAMMSSNVKLKAVAEILESLTAEQRMMLLHPDLEVLTPDQKAKLREAMGEAAAAAANGVSNGAASS